MFQAQNLDEEHHFHWCQEYHLVEVKLFLNFLSQYDIEQLTDNEYDKYNMNMEEHFMLNPHRINIYHNELNDNLYENNLYQEKYSSTEDSDDY